MSASICRRNRRRRRLGISPSTVTNPVNHIHARLEIGGRDELIALFEEA